MDMTIYEMFPPPPFPFSLKKMGIKYIGGDNGLTMIMMKRRRFTFCIMIGEMDDDVVDDNIALASSPSFLPCQRNKIRKEEKESSKGKQLLKKKDFTIHFQSYYVYFPHLARASSSYFL